MRRLAVLVLLLAGAVEAASPTGGQGRFPVLNAKDYGVKGDGSTDDTTAMQAFFTAVQGKAGFIPAGTYKVTSALSVTTSNTEIYGTRGTLISTSAVAGIVVGSSPDVNGTFLTNVTLQNVGVSSTASTTVDLVRVWHVSGAILRDLVLSYSNSTTSTFYGLRMQAVIDSQAVGIQVNGNTSAVAGSRKGTGIYYGLGYGNLPSTTTSFTRVRPEFFGTGFYGGFDSDYLINGIISENNDYGVQHQGFGVIYQAYAENSAIVPFWIGGTNGGLVEGLLSVDGGHVQLGQAGAALFRLNNSYGTTDSAGLVFRNLYVHAQISPFYLTDNYTGNTSITLDNLTYLGSKPSGWTGQGTGVPVSSEFTTSKNRIKIPKMQERTYQFYYSALSPSASTGYGMKAATGGATIGIYGTLPGGSGVVMPDKGHLIGAHTYHSLTAGNITAGNYNVYTYFVGASPWNAGSGYSNFTPTAYGPNNADMIAPPWQQQYPASGSLRNQFSAGDVLYTGLYFGVGYTQVSPMDWVTEITVLLGDDGT